MSLSCEKETNMVDHPPHYMVGDAKCAACGCPIECIDIARHQNFNVGNALKYIWRCQHKGNLKQDLAKAIWYLNDELKRLEEKKEKELLAHPV